MSCNFCFVLCSWLYSFFCPESGKFYQWCSLPHTLSFTAFISTLPTFFSRLMKRTLGSAVGSLLWFLIALAKLCCLSITVKPQNGNKNISKARIQTLSVPIWKDTFPSIQLTSHAEVCSFRFHYKLHSTWSYSKTVLSDCYKHIENHLWNTTYNAET